MKKAIWRVFVKTMKAIFIVFCVYLASLFVRPQRIPGEWIEDYVARKLPTNLVFSCSSASVGFRYGLRFDDVRLYNLEREHPTDPVAAADCIEIFFLTHRVRMLRLSIPRLHEAYYSPSVALPPGDAVYEGIGIPAIPGFELELIRPSILGVEPRVVTADVRVSPLAIHLSPIHLDWPDRDYEMSLDGSLDVDFETRRLRGRVGGLAMQRHIRPLIAALDLQSTLPYMDAFTEVPGPVPASCEWDVDLAKLNFYVLVDLHPNMGKYNGVPMRKADGSVRVDVTFPDGRMDYKVTVGPLTATDVRGRLLAGSIVVNGVNGAIDVDFDAKSELPLGSTLDVIDYLNRGELGFVECETPPVVTCHGRIAADEPRYDENDLGGHVEVARATFGCVPLKDVAFDYGYVGDTVTLSNVVATGKAGGRLSGTLALCVPGRTSSNATCAVELEWQDGRAQELNEIFDFEFPSQAGVIDGRLKMAFPMGVTNRLAHLTAAGQFTSKHGRIIQLPLFMGLTEILAKYVPGLGTIVNQTDVSASFTVLEGLLSSDDIRIEGPLFSIAAKGNYDFVKDELDFDVGVRFMRDSTVPGVKEIIRVVSWPFAKMMGLRLTGPLKNPKWTYRGPLDQLKWEL